MYQKLTCYLFPILCLKALGLLIAFVWLIQIQEYYFGGIAFFLMLFTDLLILAFNQFMSQDDLMMSDDLPNT
ncbi:hypothetical protein GCM10028805_49270 [Spirosoma harenae]